MVGTVRHCTYYPLHSYLLFKPNLTLYFAIQHNAKITTSLKIQKFKQATPTPLIAAWGLRMVYGYSTNVAVQD